MIFFCVVLVVSIAIALLGYVGDENSVSNMNDRIAQKHELENKLILLAKEYRETDAKYLRPIQRKMLLVVMELKQIEIFKS